MRVLVVVAVVLGVIWANELVERAESNDSDLTTVEPPSPPATEEKFKGLVDDREILSRILSDPKKRKRLNDLNAEYNLKLMTMIREFREKEFGVVMVDKLALTTTTTQEPLTDDLPEEEEDNEENGEEQTTEASAVNESDNEDGDSDEDESSSLENIEPKLGFSSDKPKLTPWQKKQQILTKRKALQRLKAKLAKMTAVERKKWREAHKKKVKKVAKRKAQKKASQKLKEEEKKADPIKDFFDDAKKNWEKLFPPLTTETPDAKNLDGKKVKEEEKPKKE